MYISKKGLINYFPGLAKKTTSLIINDLISIGFEVEKIYDFRKGNTNLVVGEITECIKLVNSDSLNACKVNIGTETISIICGASNVKENIKVIVALNGAKLKGVPFILEPRKIRGSLSNGMICSLKEIGLNTELYDDEENDGIHILTKQAIVGDKNIFKYLQLDDEFLDISIGSNRNDCNSTYTIARELANFYQINVNNKKLFNNLESDKLENYSKEIEIISDPKICNSVLLLKLNNVKVKPTNYNFKNNLIALKYNSINNFVDLSNYIMHETGQPVHFYDANFFNKKMKIEFNKNKFTANCLGNRTVDVDNLIVIKNDVNEIGCLGGIVGLTNSCITNDTKDIYVEIANWNDYIVRTSAMKNNISSQASKLFGKPIPENKTFQAYNLLIKELANFKKDKSIETFEVVDFITNKKNENKPIKLSFEKLNNLFGQIIPRTEAIQYLEQIGCEIIEKTNLFIMVKTPKTRTDLFIEEDLIEEILRFYGLSKIKSEPPRQENLNVVEDKMIKVEEVISNYLANSGLKQVKNYSLTSDKKSTINFFNYNGVIKINNPHSKEREVMRIMLLNSLLENIEYNANRQQKEMAFFEISSIYSDLKNLNSELHLGIAVSSELVHSIENRVKIDSSIHFIKNLIINLFDNFNFKESIIFKNNDPINNMFHINQFGSILINGEVIGYLGRLHPRIEKDFNLIYPAIIAEINLTKLFKNLTKIVKYKVISELPQSTRDFSFILKNDINVSKVIATLNIVIKKSLEEEIKNCEFTFELKDIFAHQSIELNHKSFTFKLTLLPFINSLNDKSIKLIENVVIQTFMEKYKAELR